MLLNALIMAQLCLQLTFAEEVATTFAYHSKQIMINEVEYFDLALQEVCISGFLKE